MEELEHKKAFRTRVMKMKEDPNDGLSYETLVKCRDILQPYFIGEKKVSKPFYGKG